MLRLLRLCVVSALIFGVVVLAGGYLLTVNCLQQQLQIPDQGMILTVEEGSNLNRLSAQLENDGIISGRRILQLYARFNRLNNIHAGEYQLSEGETLQQLLNKLVTGDVIQYQITFPEGLNQFQWLSIINNHPELEAEAGLSAERQLEKFATALSLPNLEGWLLPETYRFTRADNSLDIIAVAHQKMRRVLTQEWQQRAQGLPYKSEYEALIMASIIEKETGTPTERRQIAGVFVRRLEQGMRLQTDPTVIYGLGQAYDGNLTRKDLRLKTAYNTYLISGLPPTPIAMPGRAAIHAALNPDESDTLYFVAKGDGSHYFSKNLEEHLEAVRRYQLRRAVNYRSSPKQD